VAVSNKPLPTSQTSSNFSHPSDFSTDRDTHGEEFGTFVRFSFQ
jgi:hypothetical protein